MSAPVLGAVDIGLGDLDSIFNALEKWASVSQEGAASADIKHAFDTTVEQLARRGKELVTQIEGDLANIVMQGEERP